MGGFGSRRLPIYRCLVDIGSILFAAGEGKRLRPLTEDTAKPGIPLLDVPLGAWGLSSLLTAAPPVVVNASHRAEELETVLRASFPAGWELFDEGAEGFGTGGTVAALADRLAGSIVVHNGDLLTDLDPAAILETHTSRGAGITLAVRVVERGADLELAGTEIKGFVDRRVAPDAGGAQYLGVAVIEPEVAARIPKTRPLGLGESVLAPLAQRGWLAAHVHEGYALDVGTIGRYLEASMDVLYGRAPAPPVPVPGRIVEVPSGLAYTGPQSQVVEGSLAAGAVVLGGATVEDGARVGSAVVWPGETVPSATVVRDAVWFGGRAIPVRGSSARPGS